MASQAEQVRVGGWVLAEYKAISFYDVDDPAFDDYEATIVAAKSAEFLSSIRALGRIDNKKYEVYRKLARLKPKQAVAVLAELEKLGALAVERKGTEAIDIVAVTANVTTKAAVLATAAQLFELSQPSDKARATLAILDATVHLPVPESKVTAYFLKKGFSEAVIAAAITDLIHLQLLARTREKEGGDPLLYNPHAYRKNAQDAHHALAGLSAHDRQHALKLLEHVTKKPGVPFPPTVDKRIVTLLAKAGIIDISGVQLKSGMTRREFPTAPDLWGVFGLGKDGGISEDLIDDAKLLLNSLRYGELYSPANRGRIFSPAVLISALVERGQVGPATAIGEDYPLPLARGIVNLTESRLQPGRFFMELRKQDVAESVRDVLEQNVILPAGEVATPEILQNGSGMYESPEHARMKRELPKELVEARDSLVFELRTYRKRT